MDLRRLLNREEKPNTSGQLIYITDKRLFFDKLPSNISYNHLPQYKYIKRFAIVDEEINVTYETLLKNPFWYGHCADGRDHDKYPIAITHFWKTNPISKNTDKYINIDLPLFTEKDFVNKDIDDPALIKRLNEILEKYPEIKEE